MFYPVGKIGQNWVKQSVLPTNKTYYCFKDHLMLITAKLRFLVHKGSQLQLTRQLRDLPGSFWTAFTDLELVLE